MRVKAPEHPIDRLTTYELRDQREALQAALQDTLTPAERAIFEERLIAVLAEETVRLKAERRAVVSAQELL